MNGAMDAAGLTNTGGDLSLLGLFLQADWVVKTVLLLLVAASVGVWTIVFEKSLSVRRANRIATVFEDRFWAGGSLDELYKQDGKRPTHPMAAVFSAGMGEWQRSAKLAGAGLSRGNVGLRVERAITVTVSREMDRMERWMVFLASVGSTAPFVGLFGTVWGIMRSFSAIAVSENTNLSVVAPGIAEALFATAIGLVAATRPCLPTTSDQACNQKQQRAASQSGKFLTGSKYRIMRHGCRRLRVSSALIFSQVAVAIACRFNRRSDNGFSGFRRSSSDPSLNETFAVAQQR